MDEALDWAAKIPATSYGAVEVRPVHEQDDGGSEAALAGSREEVAS